jgi:hypothetical protein
MLWASGYSFLNGLERLNRSWPFPFTDYSRVGKIHQCEIDERSVENAALIDSIDFSYLS